MSHLQPWFEKPRVWLQEFFMKKRTFRRFALYIISILLKIELGFIRRVWKPDTSRSATTASDLSTSRRPARESRRILVASLDLAWLNFNNVQELYSTLPSNIWICTVFVCGNSYSLSYPSHFIFTFNFRSVDTVKKLSLQIWELRSRRVVNERGKI